MKKIQDHIRAAQDFLQRSLIAEKGWGYYKDTSQPYPEPTSYSLLALSNTTFNPDKTIDWLSSLVNADGQLYLPGDDSPNWATAHLVIALTRLDRLLGVCQASINWLLNWKSRYSEINEIVQLDSTLIGWPWISDTFSWVQPTSYAVFALKLFGYKSHDRVKEAELLLLDRMCYQGGWNFGNPYVLNHQLPASVVDTATALLALQDCPEASQAIDMSLPILKDMALSYPSAFSLAMSVLCLDIFDQPMDAHIDQLLKRQETNGSWKDMILWTALAIIALNTVNGGNNVFQL